MNTVFSKYNVYAKKDHDIHIYNLLSKRMVSLPETVYNCLANNTARELLVKSTLVRNGFIVENEDIERKKRDFLLKSMLFQSTQLNLTIMMTMKCNCSCIYCFEHKVKQRVERFNLNVVDLISWIIGLIKKYHMKAVDICFHGGEPLLEVDKILEISNGLRSFFVKNRIFYLFTTVTNGTLLTEDVVGRLKKAEVKIAQITVDGPDNIHNIRRPLKNGENGFAKIIENIGRIDHDDIKIYVNIVYDRNTIGHLDELIRIFIDKKIDKKITMIILNTVKPTMGDNFNHNEGNLTQKEEAENRIRLIRRFIDTGFKLPFELDFQLCSFKQKNSFTLLPDGSIYKCISGAGEEYFHISDIYSSEDIYRNEASLGGSITDVRCKNCRYYPLCIGSCKYESYVLYDLKRKKCRKQFFDLFLPEYIKLLFDDNYSSKFIYDPNSTGWNKEYL